MDVRSIKKLFIMGVLMSACVLAKANLSKNMIDFIDKLMPSVQSKHNEMQKKVQKMSVPINWVDRTYNELEEVKFFFSDLFKPVYEKYKDYGDRPMNEKEMKAFFGKVTIKFLENNPVDVSDSDLREALLYALCKFLNKSYSYDNVIKALKKLKNICNSLYLNASVYCMFNIRDIISNCEESAFYKYESRSGDSMYHCLKYLFMSIDVWVDGMVDKNDFYVYAEPVLEQIKAMKEK
ncbi:MAG: hypothetical protein LBH49_03035 [Puniceicoccales bacterium]|jgi:hypothetical protein|nr:hypothetical protein [Puniceicoccales bacterium]